MSADQPNVSLRRLDQVDVLRGIAAISVVLFHYTERYIQLFAPATQPAFRVSLGFHGVDLFFMVSGFVILMSLERTRTAADFLVARFSRLYPAYWVCILLTFILSSLIGPAMPLISAGQALANGLMFQSIVFGIPHLDGSYWTLDVELLFYAFMLGLFKFGQLQRVHFWLMALLGLRWVYHLVQVASGIDLPYFIFGWLNLKHIAWFALGLCIFTLASKAPHHAQRRPAIWCAGMALATVCLLDSVATGLMAVAFSWLLYGAATDRLKMLQVRPLMWLGSISYPLYLLHENVGWSLMRQLQSRHWSMNESAAAAIAVSLLLAWLVTRWVEQPALLGVRQAWKRRQRLV